MNVSMMVLKSELDTDREKGGVVVLQATALRSRIETTVASGPTHPTPRPKGFLDMLRHAAHKVTTRKGIALWGVVRYSVAGIYFWIGGTYFFGGTRVQIDPAYKLLENIEPGGIRAHGLVLMILAFSIGAKAAFHHMTQLALLATLFYSLLTAALIVGGWVIHRPDLTAPAWYVFVAVLSFALVVTSPQTTNRASNRGGGASA
jgi:hypothetical protein